MAGHVLSIVTSLAPLADPLGLSPLVAAVPWLQDTLLGALALTVAVLAVASVGFMMLTGLVNVRNGATVALAASSSLAHPALSSALRPPPGLATAIG